MGSDTAIKCFQENRVLFGDSTTQPEKFNLYNGLINLAEAVGETHRQVQQVLEEVQGLRREVRKLDHEIRQMKG